MHATSATPTHSGQGASDWVQRWSHLVPSDAAVLDVACGHGRHMRWFAERGCLALGIDRQAEALAEASAWGETVLADIENGPWPLEGRTFAAVVVTNYLWRDLMPRILESLAPGGVLIYETFAAGNESVGRPSRPEFLLQPGELLQICGGLHVVAYEDGFLDQPARFVQRIVAIHRGPPPSGAATPLRYPL